MTESAVRSDVHQSDRCRDLDRRPRLDHGLAELGADVIKIEPPDGYAYRHRPGGPGVPESRSTFGNEHQEAAG